jgi:hypothetical protein
MKRFWMFLVILGLIQTSHVSAQNEVNFTLVNKTGFEFVDIFISAADKNQWGEDLSLGVFNNLEVKDFKIKTTEKICLYDLKAVKPDSTELIFENVNLCKMLIVTLLFDFNEPMFVQDLILENITDHTFSEIYIRDLSTSFWGLNVLGANVLTPNEKAIISVKPGGSNTCLYDIKAVLLNGRELLYSNINICNQAHIVLMRYQGKPYHGFD